MKLLPFLSLVIATEIPIIQTIPNDMLQCIASTLPICDILYLASTSKKLYNELRDWRQMVSDLFKEDLAVHFSRGVIPLTGREVDDQFIISSLHDAQFTCEGRIFYNMRFQCRMNNLESLCRFGCAWRTLKSPRILLCLKSIDLNFIADNVNSLTESIKHVNILNVTFNQEYEYKALESILKSHYIELFHSSPFFGIRTPERFLERVQRVQFMDKTLRDVCACGIVNLCFGLAFSFHMHHCLSVYSE